MDFDIQPVAFLYSDKIDGCHPLDVYFSNESINYSEFRYYIPFYDSTILDNAFTFTFPNLGTYEVQLLITDTICNKVDTGRIDITVFPTPTVDIISDNFICDNLNVQLFNGSTDATQFVWSSNNTFSDTLNGNLTIGNFAPMIQTDSSSLLKLPMRIAA